MAACSECGETIKGNPNWHKCKSGQVAVAEKEEMTKTEVPQAFKPRSQRGKRAYEGDILRPIDQIRTNNQIRPDADSTGAWAYYIRPEGATIRDALVFQPNGGIPDIDDTKLRARYGTNATYYRDRAAAKGFEYIGPVLNERGVRRLVEVLAENREDEILYCEDEMANCEYTIANSDRPDVRDQARKRRNQLQRRLDTLRQPFDQDALLAELNEIAQAQMLSKVDPNVLRVMRAMFGEVNERITTMAGAFRGKPMGDGKFARPTGGSSLEDSGGADFIDV